MGVGVVGVWFARKTLYAKNQEPELKSEPESPPDASAEGTHPTESGSPPEDPLRLADKGAIVNVPVGLLPEHVRGREPFLRKLEKQFRDGGLVVLVGAGGMGKSTIARELARRISTRRADEEPVLCWEVPGATEYDFTSGMITVARDLHASEEELEIIAASKPPGPELTWKLLEHEDKRWLLIIDNADEPDFLAGPRVSGATPSRLAEGRGWVRTGRQGLMLISSRDSGEDRHEDLWPIEARLMKVPGLSDSEGARVLRDLAPHAGDMSQAKALANRLGGLPLALRLAGRYLSSKYVDYGSFEAFRLALVKDPKVIQEIDRGGDPDTLGRVMVMFTWELSLNALAKRGLPQARPLLRLLSCYASPLPIPLSLLKAEILDRLLTGPADLGSPPAATSAPVSRVLNGLDSVGLIDSVLLRDNNALRVHPVIADTNRSYLLERGPTDPLLLLVYQTSIDLLAATLDDLDEDRPADWRDFRDITPHLQAILAGLTLEAAERDPIRLDGNHLETLIRLGGHAAMAYGNMRLPTFGIDLVTSALALTPHRGENPTPIFLLARQQQAFLLGQDGRDEEAEQIYDEVLQVQLRRWPNDDPANLAVRHNLAASVGAQGRWREAHSDFLSVLADERRVLGDDHPTTLTTRRGIATLLCQRGAWEQAENELRDLLNDEQRLLAADNRTTLATRFNLAQALRHQGRNDEAEDAIGVLLQDAQRILGEEHPVTVTIREFQEDSLLVSQLFSTPSLRETHAQSLFDRAVGLGRDRDARESLEEAVAVYQELVDRYGGDPDPALRQLVAMALLNKGIVLGWLDRREDSLAAYQEVWDRHGGDPDPASRGLAARALRARAATLAGLGRPEEALPVIEQAVGLFRELAEADPETYEPDLSSAQQLLADIKAQAAQSLFDRAVGLGRDRDARESLEEAVAVYQELVDRYGGDPDPALRGLAATALLNKGVVLGWLNRPEEALAAYREVWDRYGGDPDPASRGLAARALRAQAATLAGLGRPEEALPVIEQAVGLFRELAEADPETYGPDLDSAQQLLADVKAQAAQSLFKRAVGLGEDRDAPESLEEAVAVYQDLVVRYGDDPDPALRYLAATALLNKGVVLGWLNRMGEAAAAYQDLVVRYGDDPDPALRGLAARALRARAATLAGLGRPEEALPVIEQAVGLFRELAEADPETYEPDLDPAQQLHARIKAQAAQFLFDKAVGLGEDRDSPEKLEEAVAVYQELVDRYGGDPDPALRGLAATALLNKGVVLGWLNRPEEALAAYREVWDRYGGDPDPASRGLAARALRAQAATLAGLGRPEEALPVIEQAVGLFRELAEADPETYGPDLDSAQQLLADVKAQAAQSLFKRAVGLGEDRDAPESLEEAVAVYQDLVVRYGDDPDPALRYLAATALLNKGVVLGWLNRMGEAAAAYQDLVVRYGDDPDPALRGLAARALRAQAATLAGLGRPEEALPVIEQAVGLFRELAEADPETYEPDLDPVQQLHARIKAQAAQFLFDKAVGLGEDRDSPEKLEEAVAVYQELVDRYGGDPDPALRGLAARALRAQAATLADLGRPEEALPVIEQAVGLYRELAEADPETYEPDLDPAQQLHADIKAQVTQSEQE